MLGNKHVITALLVAPILALLAYFFVDHLVREKSQPAIVDHTYPLLVKSNCRHASGKCSLVNGDIKLMIKLNTSKEIPSLSLTSNYALTHALLSFNENETPQQMLSESSEYLAWRLLLPEKINPTQTVRIAVNIQQAYYYAEFTLAFLHVKNSFSEKLK